MNDTQNQTATNPDSLATSHPHSARLPLSAGNTGDPENEITTRTLSGFWKSPAVIAPNHFVNKSLSNWAFNTAVGCVHGCLFCYVPCAATIKMSPVLSQYGVSDPDSQWGDYVFLRPWDEKKFLASLRAAERTPPDKLNPDGNRAVIYCSTTDPYQAIRHPDPAQARLLNEQARTLVRESLRLIRDHSTLNVRILTRSPMARQDFDLFRSFGDRLLFGMSLPTLRNDLSRVYEPKAPAPSQRLKTLQAARDMGLNVFVAMAPTYPECDEADLRATLKAIADLNPITVFHEPINIRAENVSRISAQAQKQGISLRTEVFASRESWLEYAMASLETVERAAVELGLGERIHLWPDKSLGAKSALGSMEKNLGRDAAATRQWLEKWWSRISEWPCCPN